MRYFIVRGSQEYGPYTLQHLRQYVASGNIGLQETARTEDGATRTEVSALLSAEAPVEAPAPAHPSQTAAQTSSPESVAQPASAATEASAEPSSVESEGEPASEAGVASAYGGEAVEGDWSQRPKIRLKTPLPEPEPAPTPTPSADEASASQMSAGAYLASLRAANADAASEPGVDRSLPQTPQMEWLFLILIGIGSSIVSGFLRSFAPPLSGLISLAVSIFFLYWSYKQASWASEAMPDCQAKSWMVRGWLGTIIGAVIVGVGVALMGGESVAMPGMVLAGLGALIVLVGVVYEIKAIFAIRAAVIYGYGRLGSAGGLRRGFGSAFMTLVFSIYYMQYHMNRLEALR